VESAHSRTAVALRCRNSKSSVVHTEWTEHALLEHSAQRRSFDSREQESEQICRVAVVKTCTGLIDERQRRQSCNPFVGRERIVDLRTKSVRIRATDRAIMKVGVAQTGTVRQEIPERDCTRSVVAFIERSDGVAQDAQ